MTAIVATCRGCGAEFEPDHAAILRGAWKTCPSCLPASTPPPGAPEGRCRECGRALQDKKRELCLGCIMGAPAL